jgi:hypothetical protein
MTGSPGRHQTSRLHGLTASRERASFSSAQRRTNERRRLASPDGVRLLMEGGQLYRGDSGVLLSLDDGELSTIEGSHELPHRLG